MKTFLKNPANIVMVVLVIAAVTGAIIFGANVLAGKWQSMASL